MHVVFLDIFFASEAKQLDVLVCGFQAVLDSLDGKKPRTKPGNVWTQDHALLRASERGRATASPGVWGKPGQLASEVRSVQNAWAKK